MRDFTPDTLHHLLSALISEGYIFITVAGFLRDPDHKCVILRHDADARPDNALKCAGLENMMGIAGTYYFRTIPGSFDETVIKEIHGLGHEIGYHYEDLSAARGDYEKAIRLFEKNLIKLRRIVPVETICMHGSPLSRFDNRKLWEKYDYRDFGIAGEPYFDIDFEKVLYMTDTGRRWDGERYRIRDRVAPPEKETIVDTVEYMAQHPVCRSTFDIIRVSAAGHLPSKIMMTLHPQRWDDNPLLWLKELLWQNIKNAGKGIIYRTVIRR